MGKKILLFLMMAMLVMASLMPEAAMAQPDTAATEQQVVVKAKKVMLDKKRLTMTIGDEMSLAHKVSPENATDTAVTYTSSNASVAAVDGEGKITALKKGSATITARAASGAKAKCTVKVLAPPPNGISLDADSMELAVKGKAKLTATVTPGNASGTKVKFTSSNKSVVRVDAKGNLTGVKSGSAVITAKTSNGLTATCTVSVGGSAPQQGIEPKGITLDKPSITVAVGKSDTLRATVSPANAANKTVSYTSLLPSVATVDQNGKVTGVKAGTTTIIAMTANGLEGKCAVTVVAADAGGLELRLDQTSMTLSKGDSKNLVATVLPESTPDKSVSFSSSNTAVATVDKTGKVTGVKAGSANVFAATGSGLIAVCSVTVTDGSAVVTSVTLNKKVLQLFANTSETLVATLYPANAADKSVTYSTNNAAVAVVDSNGKVSALSEGSATITVTAAGGATDACLVTVTSASSTLDTIIEVVRLCNVERQKAGLGALSMDAMLNVAADIRSRELVTRFDHTRPDGTDCLTVFGPLGITFRMAGENVAMGQRTPSEVVQDWMNSEGHRANILRSGFGKIGVGVYRGSNGVVYWTQLFTD